MEEEWWGGRLRQKDAGSEKLNWFGRPPWISSWKVTCIPILFLSSKAAFPFQFIQTSKHFWLKRLLSKQFYSSHCIQHPLAQDGMLAEQRLWWPTGTGTSRIEVRRLRTLFIPKVLTGYNFRVWSGPPCGQFDRVHGWYFDRWGESSKEAYALFWCIAASRRCICSKVLWEGKCWGDEGGEGWRGTDHFETWRLRWMAMFMTL